MRLLTHGGGEYPLWFNNITDYASIAVADFSPVATYLAGAATSVRLSACNVYIKHGFAVKNATENAGYIWAITWTDYQGYLATNKENPLVITSITPRQIYLLAGEWCLTPVIKVFAGNDGSGHASTVATINVGTIR